jgi:hypothetical protein
VAYGGTGAATVVDDHTLSPCLIHFSSAFPSLGRQATADLPMITFSKASARIEKILGRDKF